jgi:hypothetical protein
LPESFNLDLYLNPVWKSVERTKWLTVNGMDNYAGVTGAHVGNTSAGMGKAESHINSVNGAKAWRDPHNENSPGAEPFTIGYAEQ